MSQNRAIIDTSTSNPRLIFPGPGGVEITLSPGSESFELVQAPSGHLILPISDYAAAIRDARKRDRPTPPPPAVALEANTRSSGASSSQRASPLADIETGGASSSQLSRY